MFYRLPQSIHVFLHLIILIKILGVKMTINCLVSLAQSGNPVLSDPSTIASPQDTHPIIRIIIIVITTITIMPTCSLSSLPPFQFSSFHTSSDLTDSKSFLL